MVDLSLIIPCYNDGHYFIHSLEQIKMTLDVTKFSYEIIVVDDGSQKQTLEILKSLPQKIPNTPLNIIYHSQNMGRGAALKTGFKEAKGEIVGFIDIDLEIQALHIIPALQFLKKKEADVILANRIYKLRWNLLSRWIVSLGYKNITRFLFHTQGLDTEAGFKFFNFDKTKKMLLHEIKACHWFWDTEVILQSLQHHFKIVQIPVLFTRREDKRSSVHFVKDIVYYLKKLLCYKFHLKEYQRNSLS